ncbi:hypothetical protein L6470_02525 [Prevotella communis]|uniref:hypothetical protein n=1 Tax=Prevotella communis TaxID=2913614 RepID=UPI001ED9CD90|nr:hypothetical protein [Prevotella communis]UKK59903.1 hypothetical protein L6470_02525 [Prevotella communis]
MKTISRYIMTLALLLTAVTGAWAADTYTITFSGFGNEACNKTVTDATLEYSETFNVIYVDANFMALIDVDGSNEYVSISNSQDETQITITVKSAFEGTEKVTVYYVNEDGDEDERKISVTCVKNAPAVEVTTNAASKQDLFTEASFTMPPFDATVNYMLVRDMQDEANPVAFSGLPTNNEPIIVKKGSDGKYQPAEALTIQLIDPLAAAEAQNIIAADGITVKVLMGAVNELGAIDYDQDNPITLEAFLADMKPGYYWIKAEQTDENSPYDGTVYSSEFTVVEKYDLTVKPANDFSKGKIESVTVGSGSVTIDANTGEATKTGIAPDTEVKIKAKRGYVIDKVETGKTVFIKLSAATAENIGMVACNKGHLHDAKTAVPAGCTAVGILGKVTATGHGLILALKNATSQTWNTINGWSSVTAYAGTTLKVLPDDAARGTNLTSYTTLGETTVSNWAVAQKSDYETIFTNLGSTTRNDIGTTYDANVNAYITTGVGGAALSDNYWPATEVNGQVAWLFHSDFWSYFVKTYSSGVRPVLGF